MKFSSNNPVNDYKCLYRLNVSVVIFIKVVMFLLLSIGTRAASISATVLILATASDINDSDFSYSSCTPDKYRPLTLYWTKDLERKKSLADYPVNINVEYIATCNFTRVKLELPARLNNKTKPPVSLILGPDLYGGFFSAEMAAQNSIPHVEPVWPPDNIIAKQPFNRRTSFTVSPTGLQMASACIDAYIEAGAKTLVAVSVNGGIDDSQCLGGAVYAKSRGMIVQATYNFSGNYTMSKLVNLVRHIRDNYNPDALLWCHFVSGGFIPGFVKFHVLPILKSENYLPKALFTIGSIDLTKLDKLAKDGLLLYVTAPDVLSPLLNGKEQTQEENPFANLFRNTTEITVSDKLNAGVLTPSSHQIFRDWFKSVTKQEPNLPYYYYWASLDLIESAIYRAAAYRHPNLTSQYIEGREVLGMMHNSQIRSPLGRVVFNSERTNDATTPLMLQTQSTSGLSPVVAPKSLQTGTFIYPMPTWDERVYTWHLLKGTEEIISLVVATICSFVLVALAVTAIVKREESNVKMLSMSHIVLFCVLSAAVCFGVALVWQADATQSQCDSILWIVFLPMSFVLNLISMKAYRLSFYLRTHLSRKHTSVFSHLNVIEYTMSWTLLTVALLLLIKYVDPFIATRVVLDPLRPKYDHYECHCGITGSVLLYFSFAIHVTVSFAAVSIVRNGTQAFLDGSIMRDAFLLIYSSIILAFTIEQLGVSYHVNYVVRSVLVSVGITSFCGMLLFNRCVVHWFPDIVKGYISAYVYTPINNAFEYITPKYDDNDMSSAAHSVEVHDAPIYSVEPPPDDEINKLLEVFHNSNRYALLHNLASKLQIVENVTFIKDVMEYQQNNSNLLINNGRNFFEKMRENAVIIYRKYGYVGAEDEINISDKQKREMERNINEWNSGDPLFDFKVAEKLLSDDNSRRNGVFDAAFKEILLMLYQNIWDKFKQKEIEIAMNTTSKVLPF